MVVVQPNINNLSGKPSKNKPRKRVNTAEKRASHNLVERQRREQLNGRFLDLARLLPSLASQKRPSKSAIVNGSITHLTSQRNARLIAAKELRALFTENQEILQELNEYRVQTGKDLKVSIGWTAGMEEVVKVEDETFGTFTSFDEEGLDGDDAMEQEDLDAKPEAGVSGAYDIHPTQAPLGQDGNGSLPPSMLATYQNGMYMRPPVKQEQSMSRFPVYANPESSLSSTSPSSQEAISNRQQALMMLQQSGHPLFARRAHISPTAGCGSFAHAESTDNLAQDFIQPSMLSNGLSVQDSTPEWLDALHTSLKTSLQTKTPKGKFVLPPAPDFLPSVSPDCNDTRGNAKWWLPKTGRELVWKGKTVIIVGGKTPTKEEDYFKQLGANVKRLDILSSNKRVKDFHSFMEGLQPLLKASQDHYNKCFEKAMQAGRKNEEWMKDATHAAIAVEDVLFDKYEADGIDIFEVIQPIETGGLPLNVADNWWMSLTKNDWRDFARSAHKDNDRASETQSMPIGTAKTGASFNQQSVGIPSTHPEEKEQGPPPPPPRPLPMRARQARRPISLLDGDSDDDSDPPPRPIKRIRREHGKETPVVTKTLAPQSVTQGTAQSLSETQKSTATQTAKARPGKSRSGLLDDIDEMDDDSSSYGKTAKSLEAYRGLYDSVKQSAGNDPAKKRNNQTHGWEEEEDFVERSLMRQKAEADPANRAPNSRQADGSDYDQGMEVDKQPQTGPSATTGTAATVRQPFQVHHVEPTRPEDVTKDTEFLQAATKARKGAKELDEFDLEFNALKIAKPKTAQAPKIYGAGLFDPSRIYNSVLDLDSDVTGNFIKIERVNLFRKDKDQQQEAPPNYDWAGRPNFKKFKKQTINRAPPIKLKLAPAADYGIGLEYWPDKKTKEGTAEQPLNARPQANQSQATQTQTQAVTQSAGPTATGARPRRRLLPVDSDDDTGIMALPTLTRDAHEVTQTRPGRSASTATRNSTAQPTSQASTSRGVSRGSSNLLAVESDEDQPVRRVGRRVGTAQEDTSQADDVVGSISSHNTSATSSTNKRKRLVAMDDDDSDDAMIFPGARRKRR